MGENQKRLYPLLIGLLAFVAIWVVFLYNSEPTGKATQAESRLGSTIADLNVLDSGGAEVTLLESIEVSGREYALFSLWATWCAPCVEELPLLEARKRLFEYNGISVMLINYDLGSQDEATRRKITHWLKEKNVDLSTLYDPAENLLESLMVYALPYNVLLSKEGEVLYVKNGIFEEGKIIEAAQKHQGSK